MANKAFVTGLPRAGSTLLCQLLGEHPDVASDGHSSPLLNQLENLRAKISDDPFLLSRLDVDLDATYERVRSMYRGMVNGWLEGWHDKTVVIDKNRGWLRALEFALEVLPDAKFLICIRDLEQVYGSIEAAHRKTILLDFPDHMAPHSPDARASSLFDPGGVVGGPLGAIREFSNSPVYDEFRDRCYYVAYEALVARPQETMRQVYSFLGIGDFMIDPENLSTKSSESDSWYRMKYSHKTRSNITQITQHTIDPSISSEIRNRFKWYYEQFYPAAITDTAEG